MPSNQNPEIIAMRDKLMQFIAPNTAVPIQKAMETNVCAKCGKDASSFTDELSEREYKISQLCQTCQDDAFGA